MTKPNTATEDPLWYEIVWGQFRKRTLAFASLYGVLGLILVAIYAPLMSSNKPFLWNAGQGWSSPWLYSLFDRNFYENSIDIFFNSLLLPGTFLLIPALILWRRIRHQPRKEREATQGRILRWTVGIWALCLSVILLFPYQSAKVVFPVEQAHIEANGGPVQALYPPLPFSYRDGNIEESGQSISITHPLGTDASGCDVLAEMLFGTRISLTVGIFAVAIYCSFGTLVGALAGFFGGRIDNMLMRLVEVVICIPSMFLVLTVASFITHRSIFHIMLIIAAVAWTGPARLVRAEFLRLRELDFVVAARAAGFSKTSIIFEEILPNALGPVLVSATFGVASAILVESTMSFLGLGDITVPSWGQILKNGRDSGAWTLILAPGFAIFTTVSLLNLVGEGFRDALDPKLRR